MNYRLLRLSSLIVLLAMVVGSAFSVRAQEPKSSSHRSLRDQIKPMSSSADNDGQSTADLDVVNRLAESPTKTARVVIELRNDPTAVVYEKSLANKSTTKQAVAAAQTQLAQVNQAQQRVGSLLATLGVREIYRTQRVYNGIAAEVNATQLEAIRKMPDVKAVHALITKYRENATSVPLIGAPQVWNGMDGFAGEGISIGIIDSGIDYLHTDFGGAGTPAAYAANNTTVITDNAGFPNAKVVGGYDFAGNDYNADPDSDYYQPIPHPDPDPLDCSVEDGGGHGTHVAGTAAGYGVNADGSTYTGTYGTSTDFANMKIGPGVAPKASLYALRVFGCDGSTDITDLAIEWAVDPNGDGDFTDHLDVINMSLGSPFGSMYDSSTVASDNAVAAGVIVVTSAGNSGDVYYITGSPGSAARAISVASSADNGQEFEGMKVLTPPSIAGVYPVGIANFGAELSSTPLVGNVKYPQSNTNGCASFATGTFSNTIALIDRGSCSFKTKAYYAEKAGAIAVIIVNNQPGPPAGLGDDPTLPYDVHILAVMVSQADGAKIKTELSANNTVTVELSSMNDLIVQDLAVFADTLSSFSSRGSRRGDSALKPDIAAPGQNITSARSGGGSDKYTISGTSMASPHMAGVMALLREIHPEWTVEELKALAMNTATHDIRSAAAASSAIFGPGRIGAGRVDVPNAAMSDVIIYNDDNRGFVSASFGAPQVVGTKVYVKNLRVVNKGENSATFNVAYRSYVATNGVSYLVNPPSLSLGAGESTSVQVLLTVNADLMNQHNADPTVAKANRAFMTESSGYIELTNTDTNYRAMLVNTNEVPIASTPNSALATFNLNGSNLSYNVQFTQPLTITGAHIHRGSATENGPVAYGLSGAASDISSLTGSVTLNVTDTNLLKQGKLYINVHTAQHPGGAMRAQIVPATPTLRLPVFVAPRPASDMRVDSTNVDVGNVVSDTLSFDFVGQDVDNGALGSGFVSLASTYELQYSSPNDNYSDPSLDSADLKYVGIANDFMATGVVTETVLSFGIATHGKWSSPSSADTQFDIYIDSDRDGEFDYILYNRDTAARPSYSDQYVSRLVDLKTGEFENQYPLNAVNNGIETGLFNNNVMSLLVDAAFLGLDDENTTFDYVVAAASRDYPLPFYIDVSPVLTYDVANPGYTFIDSDGEVSNLHLDLNGNYFEVDYNRSGAFVNKNQGILVFHHLNTGDATTEVIKVNYNLEKIFLPIIKK